MTANEPLYLAPETLYRIGNSSSPLLTKVRRDDVDLVEINGVPVVIANGRGVSLYNKDGLDQSGLVGWLWEIPASTPLPPGLMLRRTPRPPGHYNLCPARNMPLSELIALIDKVVIHCRKLYRKQA